MKKNELLEKHVLQFNKILNWIKYKPLSYLSLVNNVSDGTDHAGSTAAKYLFDPQLLQGRAQLAHGQVALRHLKLPLDTEGAGGDAMTRFVIFIHA